MVCVQVSGEDYSVCWPRDWLAEDGHHVRVLGVDFDSYLSQWGGACPTQSFRSSLGKYRHVLCITSGTDTARVGSVRNRDELSSYSAEN